MYQEVCFNRGTEAGGGVNVGHSLSPPPQSFYACYGPDEYGLRSGFFLSEFRFVRTDRLSNFVTHSYNRI